MANYFARKEEMKRKAQNHTDQMEYSHKESIEYCIDHTDLYDTNFEYNDEHIGEQEVIIDELDTVSALYKYKNDNRITAILNFASYKNPGGMFFKGSSAQEESICHESVLYNVLREFPEYYDWNKQHKHYALYLNRALYSQDVLFTKDDEDLIYADVITCAAPNKGAAQKYCNISDEKNYDALYERIKFVLDIASFNNVDTLILGAFGCGVFKQDPREVADLFKQELIRHKTIKTVIFAIPNKNSMNYKAFEEMFENEGN